ncbi:MAG TPA: hypothetical protein VFA26_18445, partial [Gemmataceae bacterium]|nr:hypothetical protein [Gemmataceae bacterium]
MDNQAKAANAIPDTPAAGAPPTGPGAACPQRARQASGIYRFFNHPTGFWFFFWGELAERSSFYGMRAILFLYLAEQLDFGKDNASTINHLFIAACYFLPLIGGYIADNFFGKYWTIVGFSLPYILGQLLLCIDSEQVLGIPPKQFIFVSLVLLAMGSGV